MTNRPPVPDYGTVQATLCTNLMRRGVVDDIIPREELAIWSQVLSDLACKPLQDEIERLRAANQKMKSALEYYADDGPTPNVDGPWKATSWDFGSLARCTLAELKQEEG